MNSFLRSDRKISELALPIIAKARPTPDNDYLKILNDEEVKDFVAINFSKYFKSISEEQNIRKFAKSHYIFLKTPDEVEK